MTNKTAAHRVGAVVLAAGESRRMGSPKMILPWGSTTVIGQVVDVLLQCGVDPVVVVTGGAQEGVQRALDGTGIIFAHNASYQTTEMLDSLRIGLSAQLPDTTAVLVALGDQPQIQAGTVESVVERYLTSQSPIVVPSYQLRRGHPWLLDRSLWDEIQHLDPKQTMRDFLNAHANKINYLIVETSSILGDLDTPLDYEKAKPVDDQG